MFVTKVKLTVVVLLALGVLGSGAGMFARHTAAGAPAPAKAAAKAPDKPPEDKGGPAAEVKADNAPTEDWPRDPRDALNRVVDFKGFDDPKTTLDEALTALGKMYHVTFDVNERAFNFDNVKDVLKTEVASPNPLPPMRTSLATVLRKLLQRVGTSGSGATWIIRRDVIEITITNVVRDELGIPEGRALLPLVYEDFEEQAPPSALRKLAGASGMSVVLDTKAAAGDKLPKVTAEFHNVPVDTAVRVLADVADLGMVRLDNVLYVTTRENATRLQEEQDRAAAKANPPAKPAAPEAKPAKPDKANP
jgi:hypothetical protein